MRVLISIACFLALATAAQAERCEKTSCVGSVFYMHVPRGQFRSTVIFQAGGLPNVNEIVALSDAGSLLPAAAFESPWVVDLRKDLAAAVAAGRSLPGWGKTLRSGSKVKILAYQRFPELGAQSEELFALVIVLSDG